jgi:hypothetical protein
VISARDVKPLCHHFPKCDLDEGHEEPCQLKKRGSSAWYGTTFRRDEAELEDEMEHQKQHGPGSY